MNRVFSAGLRLVLFCAALTSRGQVILNEFMADNQTTLADEDGAYPDWIELYNTAASPVSLSGWSLTDDPAHVARWSFPATNLAGNGFMVVFASGKNRAVPGAPLHTDFSLKAGGEYLALLQPDTTAASEFTPAFPPQYPDISYGVVPGVTTNYFDTPSPGAPNGSGFIQFVADTRFDPDRGFYDAAFDLSITTATANATLVYTKDGSVPSLSNGTIYTAPIPIAGTTVIRAAAFKDGFAPSGVDTQTYLFLADVIRQSPNGETPPGWPASWGANVVDYGMDPAVVNDAAYSGEIIQDLKSIPTFSIVTELDNLFDPSTGIYANASQDGLAWERPASVELIHPDGTKGFQVNAGLRIRGGYSRSTGNPKHAFRFFFRQQYGASKLNYPVFARQGGATTFDALDLRTLQNYSWSFEGDYRFIALRDQFSRDTQLAQGHQGERGDFYHLYLNGRYWGLYNTAERPEASFGATYFGGNKEDYDVIKVDTGAGYTLFATDGNLGAWTRLWQAATNGFASDTAYFKVQGRNVDGTANPAYENLLEVDNLIDYMLVIFFTGNIDAPISAFIGNSNPNNLYALRNRTGLYGGFRFLAHDSEHTLLHESSLGNNDELHRDRTGPFAAGDPTQQGAASALGRSNPQYLFTRLTANAEFRLRLADHVQKQFFNGGVLTPEGCRARFLTRSNEVYGAVAAESARWGDSKVATPRTRNVDWVKEMNRVYGDYFAQRPGIVLAQLKAKGWFPSVNAPSFNQLGGDVPAGFQLTLIAPAGTIYYTRDGSDPRLRGGAVSPAALGYGGPLTLTASAQFKARVLSGATWSALTDATFYVIRTFQDLLITEIMYHPPGTTNQGSDALEFVELKNAASTNLELSGVHFTNGIQYVFPVGTVLGPGQFVVLASDPVALATRYPGVRVDGTFTNHLANGGETVALVHANGTLMFSVAYGTRPPWPESADGTGFSLVPVNPNLNPDPNDPANWRASTVSGGSPGADDPPSSIGRILVNEALTHTDPPQPDSVELYNPNPTNVDIGHWFLTDQRALPRKFRIAVPAVIPAGGYRVLTENDWNADPTSTNSFRLDSHGEEIYLYSADPAGNLTGYSDGFAFGAAQNGVSFGRYLNSVGDVQYPAQETNTLNAPNAGPRVGPVVINEIQYHPVAGDVEFVELKSITNGTVPLYDPLVPTNTWRIDGLGFSFPMTVELPAQGLLLVVGGDPTAFRVRHGVPAAVPVLGPFAGTLQDGGETVALQRPDTPDLDTNTGTLYVPYIDVDVVRYNDKAPWPTNADGLGPSLERLNAGAYGNDPINWRASPGPASPGLENTGNRRPVVDAGGDQSLAGATFPMVVTLAGSVRDDSLPGPPAALRVTWSQVSGPGKVWFSNANQAATTASLPGVGTYGLRLTADDGELQASDDVTVTLQRTLSPVTIMSKGSVWKYLDNGSNQGTGWTARTFNDSTWASGAAPLGYGDANGIPPTTPVGWGPDANNKYITTYFRRAFTVSNAAAVTNLMVNVQRDDGVVVYLNGTPIFTNNLPDVSISYQTFASGTAGTSDETAFYSQPVDPALLLEGTNVLTAEIHQVNLTSTDIIFDLELTGATYPPNLGPSASAGPDQVITLPAAASLHGSVSDDGLPIPPGLLTFAWSKVSGPGTVSFADPQALDTTASFSGQGAYGLRLSAGDGAQSAADELTVTVNGPSQQTLKIETVAWDATGTPVLHVWFAAVAGQTYTVQCRDSLTGGGWSKLTDVAAQGQTGLVEVSDPTVPGSATRYYRLVTPQQP